MKNIPYLTQNYETSEDKSSFWSDIKPLNNLFFYCNFLGLTIKNGVLAKRGKYDAEAWRASSFECFKLMEKCGGKFMIKGIEAINNLKSPAIFAGNHMSTLETIVLVYLLAPNKLPSFIIKEELLKVPFFKWLVKSQRSIVVSRKDPLKDLRHVLSQGEKVIKEGRSIIVFPGTTRSTLFNKEGFSSLGVSLAKRCKVPLVPVALKTDFWGNGRLIKDFGPINPSKTIHFEFGNPLKIAGLGRKEHHQTVNFIEDRLQTWGISPKTT